MAFSSVQFLFVFLPLSLAVYWLCPKWLRNAVLAAFSLVLLAGINWLGGLSLGRLAHKRPLLILLILLDLAVLGGFKYAGFAAETVNALAPGLLPVLSPALPLGLSFYVFTAIGYCADVAAGKVKSEKNPIRFAVFLAFFGHGPSGPIVRYGQQAPQLDPASETLLLRHQAARAGPGKKGHHRRPARFDLRQSRVGPGGHAARADPRAGLHGLHDAAVF